MTAPTTPKPAQRPAQRPLPAGAARWARMFVDAKGLPQTSPFDVPVDANDRRTNHVRWFCRGHHDETLTTGQVRRVPCDTTVWRAPDEKGGFCPDHGAALVPDGATGAKAGMPWADLWTAAKEPAKPLWALAAVAMVGAGMHDNNVSPGQPAALTPVLAAAGYFGARSWLLWRAEKTGKLDKGQRTGRRYDTVLRRARAAAYIAAGSGAWLTAAAAVDPSTVAGKIVWGALPPLWAISAAPWWRHLAGKRRNPEVQPAAETSAPPVDTTHPQARLDAAAWAETVAAGAGLPNTWVDIDTWKPDPSGRSMVVRCKGALTDERIRQSLPLIASAFDVLQSAIGWVAEFEGSPRSAQILVQPNSHLDREVAWKPPTVLPIDEAVLHVGTQMDGGDLHTQLWTPGWGAPSRSIYGTKGSGKALALDTPIPTPRGWTTMGDLNEGDQVFDETGAPCTVTLATPVMLGHTCFEVVFSDGATIVADADHLWKTTTTLGRWQRANHSRPSRAKACRDGRYGRRADHLRRMHDVEPVTTADIAATLTVDLGGKAGPTANHAVDLCGPLEYAKQDLPVGPYTLGAWLGDGRTKFSSIASADEEVLEEIRLEGYIVRPQGQRYMYGLLNGGKPGESLPALLRQIGVLGNKHIPDLYLRSSIDQRMALLAGLLDTDGTCTKAGGVEFSNTNKRLAEDVFELTLGLGFKATMRAKRVKGRTEASSTCYTVAFRPDRHVFRLSRKAARFRPVEPTSTSRRRYIVDVRQVPSVPVRCIQVDSPNRLYLAGRACIPTHNTEAVRLMLLGQLLALVDTDSGPRRLVAPFLHDPKLGKDFGAFRRQVCGFSSDQATLHMMVDALIREMDRRYDSLATYTWRDHKGRLQEGEQPFDPTVHGPIISVWIDEFHEPSRDQTLMAKLDPMARKMRAAGIEFNVATHMTTLSDTGSRAFRDMVAEEVFLFRTTSGLTSLATGGQLTGDPRLLPRVPGSLFHAAGEQNTVRSRFAYVPRNELYDMLYDDDNESRTVPVEWPAETLEAFGPEFVGWMRACQERAPGAAAPPLPTSGLGRVEPAEDRQAADALRLILFGSARPLARKEIADHPLWVNAKTGERFGVTSTLTKALRDGQDADPAWAVKAGAGPSTTYELAGWAREQMTAVSGESDDEVAE